MDNIENQLDSLVHLYRHYYLCIYRLEHFYLDKGNRWSRCHSNTRSQINILHRIIICIRYPLPCPNRLAAH